MKAAYDVPPERLTVSVIICTFTERRWEDITSALIGLAAQSSMPDEVIMVVDHNDGLLKRAKREFAGVTVLPNVGNHGLSDARNTGIRSAKGHVVAFLDDDAVPATDWVSSIVDAFTEAEIVCVGGLVYPVWPHARRPCWFPPEFDWVVGCSYVGLPSAAADIRNPIGASMAFRREIFHQVGYFDSSIGRLGNRPLGCEETELCIRIRQQILGARVRFAPAAVVHHRVTSARVKWSYFCSRCYSEGLSKALVSTLVGSQHGLSSERTYVTETLSAAARREGFQALKGEFGAVLRIAAGVCGLAITTIGYIVGRASLGQIRVRKENL